MTPFDSWYAANVEANLPKDFPAHLRVAGKAEAAKVWNAALDCGILEVQPISEKIKLEHLRVKA